MAHLTALEVEGYGPLRHVRLERLGGVTFVVGPNGSGKSSLLDALTFVRDAVGDGVLRAVEDRGGMETLVHRDGRASFSVALDFELVDGARTRYEIEIAERNGAVVVERERVLDRSPGSLEDEVALDGHRGHGSPKLFPGDGIPTSVNMDEPNDLILPFVARFWDHRALRPLDSALMDIELVDDRPGQPQPSLGRRVLDHPLARRAADLFTEHPDHAERILSAMRRIPGIDRVEVERTQDKRVVVRFGDAAFQDPFSIDAVSDGTLAYFALLVRLHAPDTKPLLLLEEPERQLYPDLLPHLYEELRGFAKRGGQVIATTHSPDLLSCARLDEVYALHKSEGFATAHRAADSDLLRSLYEAGDPPGALWKQGLFDHAFGS